MLLGWKIEGPSCVFVKLYLKQTLVSVFHKETLSPGKYENTIPQQQSCFSKLLSLCCTLPCIALSCTSWLLNKTINGTTEMNWVTVIVPPVQVAG